MVKYKILPLKDLVASANEEASQEKASRGAEKTVSSC